MGKYLAHLSGRNDLKWSQRSLQVGSVGLEIVQSTSNAGLELRWALAGWAVGRDLVEGAHIDWLGVRIVVRKKELLLLGNFR